MGPTWPHLFLFLCNAKNAKNGISAVILEPKELDHEPVNIQNHILNTCTSL